MEEERDYHTEPQERSWKWVLKKKSPKRGVRYTAKDADQVAEGKSGSLMVNWSLNPTTWEDRKTQWTGGNWKVDGMESKWTEAHVMSFEWYIIYQVVLVNRWVLLFVK